MKRMVSFFVLLVVLLTTLPTAAYAYEPVPEPTAVTVLTKPTLDCRADGSFDVKNNGTYQITFSDGSELKLQQTPLVAEWSSGGMEDYGGAAVCKKVNTENGALYLLFRIDLNDSKRCAVEVYVTEPSSFDYTDCSTEFLPTYPTGWRKENGRWYYLKNGLSVGDWQKIGGKWYYFDYFDHTMQKGWYDELGTWYYLGTDGAMRTGWCKVGSRWYYFGSNGAMQTDWKKIGGKWYYFDENGRMLTGWQEIDWDEWYYFNSSGAMVTGWQKISGKWYYFKPSGLMATGWVKSGGSWYYMDDASGAMKVGWLDDGDGWYYFNSSGAMVTGKQVISGKSYQFGTSGKMKKSGGSSSSSDGYQSTVYITRTGKRYHYDDHCNGGTYYPASIDSARARGLTPCRKCVN